MRVVVIGSGIGGASCAYHLARRGAEVVVVDANENGAATSAGAGIISPWTSRRAEEDVLALEVRAGAYYPTLIGELAEEGEDNTSFAIVGGLVVSEDDTVLAETAERLTRRARRWPELGEVSVLDPKEARELFPPLAEGFGAVHVTGAGRVDGRALRAALLRAAGRHGARSVTGRAELVTTDGRVRGVVVAGERVDADAVVVAAGAWSPAVLAPLGVRPAVEPQRGQISHFGLSGTDTSAWPVVLPPSSHYLLAFPDSRVVAGATRETGSGFDYRVTAEGQREVLDHALRVAPGLGTATVIETRVGFRPATEDGLPVVGALDDHPEVVLSTGFGPAGLTVGPYAGRLVAQIVLGERPETELDAVSPRRFTAR
ncbi:NAD(P)/FAD-dependent oxidoreductase [Saccharomonospora glauca]|jgi:D-amino-acid dehydrogenase|uniref:Glycine/D-amino acid oxidase, deaminating n=1 Tax=Saccharomonospora glauca K62 TaxID=928724 RepID=I1CZB4_9PSEU|nr:FAD-dependent oxidoreductase [Saccharomonospora glauca]EIE98038.1 glycine/D-amino acid oxidase, deaminating [Saccharomonospora glauca K62]